MDLVHFNIYYNNPQRWNMKSCIYDCADCSYNSHQHQNDPEIVKNMGPKVPMQFAAYAVTHDGQNRSDSSFKSVVIGGVCWFHAESDPNSAFLKIAKKADVDISECEVWRFVNDPIKTFRDLGIPEPRVAPPFNEHEYKRDNADAKSVVVFGTPPDEETEEVEKEEEKEETKEEKKPSMFLRKGDYRCIHAMERCSNYRCVCNERCSNTEVSPGGFGAVIEKEMPLPAYLVYHKDYKQSGHIGSICYSHAVTLQAGLRRIADKATRDNQKGIEVTLDDLWIEIHWNSNGHKPDKYNEKTYRVDHVVNPDWKPTDPLCQKWKRLEGNVGTCRHCNHQYIVPYSMDYSKILPKEVIEAPDYFYVGLYCCKECQTKIQARGCGNCGCKLTKANTWHGTVDFSKNDKMFCRKCFKCQCCGQRIKEYAEGYTDEEREKMTYTELSRGTRAGLQKIRKLPGAIYLYDSYRKCKECDKKQGSYNRGGYSGGYGFW